MNITACLGTRNCKFGIIDSVGLAEEIDKKFFGKELPVKVRIAISSCPNGCESERLNEIGITGIQKPIRDPGLCTGCGTCAHYCREKAIEVQDGIIVLHDNQMHGVRVLHHALPVPSHPWRCPGVPHHGRRPPGPAPEARPAPDRL